MDTKWKKSSRSGTFLGFLAFVLSVSLLLDGAVYFGNTLCSARGRRQIADSFAADWRDSGAFRQFVGSRLETLITMGAGGLVYGYDGYWDINRENYYKISSNRSQAIHDKWKDDKNVLYTVAKDGETLYSNSETLHASTAPAGLPEGYGFLVQFDGAKVRAWKDGSELDLYGDGYYRYDSAESELQWYLPGYRNFTVDEAGAKVRVTMAVIDVPQTFVRGGYGKDGTQYYNELYYVKQNLADCRAAVSAHGTRLAFGAGLFLLYVVLRRGKRQADQVLARWTGKLWFEAKLLLTVSVVFLFLPRPAYLGQVWSELTYAYAPTVAISGGSASAASDVDVGIIQEDVQTYEIPMEAYQEQTDRFGRAMTILSENGGWLLREYLGELAQATANLLVIFWTVYLLVFNDWRYNPGFWKHGVFGLIAAGESKYPLQKQLRRMNGFFGLAVGTLWLETLSLLVLQTVRAYLPAWFIWNLLGLPWLLSAVVWGWFYRRQKRLWQDFGAVSEQLAAIRNGSLTDDLLLPEDAGLYQMADDLNHIRQGLHQAVEERTQSERMKVELVTNVSHDLKTPLTSILSYTELLAQEPLEPPASEYVQIMSQKAQRLKAMVQDVFEVSKAASGQLPVKLERLDYARLLRQTLADMAQAIEASGLTFRTDLPETEVPITADSDRLYRVFQNLIGNALKYSLPGSRVYLNLSVEHGSAIASVRNTSAEELKPGVEYTARFVRGDESRSDGGSGLGLSIAQSFAQACGGELSISTDADLFTAAVTFPLGENR